MNKKIIQKIGFIIFSSTPLITVAFNSNTASLSEKLVSKITQNFKTKLKTNFLNNWIFQIKKNNKKSKKDTNKFVWGDYIFEDSRGNLWIIGVNGYLQKYNYDIQKWIKDTSSNITDVFFKKIFEDSLGNLWSKGYGTPLQKYNYKTNKWNEETSSNIKKNEKISFFEDSRGNLWLMGNGIPLQKYDYDNQEWIEETKENSNNNIINGLYGTFFEDSRGNLWLMGNGTPLQKYDYDNQEWIEETKENSNNNIINGLYGTFFEDSRGNLWAMGDRTPLQKYDYVTKKWNTNYKGDNINNLNTVVRLKFFEDSRGNLWAMGDGIPLQKYDYDNQEWIEETKKNSNITDASNAKMFEDSRGNLWAMTFNSKLQKYDYDNQEWIEEIKDNSNNIKGQINTSFFEDSRGNLWITRKYPKSPQKYDYNSQTWTSIKYSFKPNNGYINKFFEDSRGNLWAMGSSSVLQKLTSQKDKNPKTKNFDITFKTQVNPDGKIAVLIKGYHKYTSNQFTHLQYKKKNGSIWKIVKKRIIILEKDNYEFKWVIGTDERIASDSRIPVSFEIRNDGYITKKDINITNLKKESFDFIGINGAGTIKLKQSIDLPAQVEPRYYIGLKSNPIDTEYESNAPSELVNNRFIKIKFFIKDEDIDTHKFPESFKNQPIKIKITGLPEGINIITDVLKKETFFIAGFNGAGTIKSKQDINIPSQVIVKYNVETKSITNDKQYKITAPKNLKNGQIIKIRFFIKENNINTHKFPETFVNTKIPIKIKVENLPEGINVVITKTNPKNDFFIFSGFNGDGTIKLKSDVVLPPQVEPRYYEGTNPSYNILDYKNSAPTVLSNGKKIWIKFFIKDAYKQTHKFPNSFANSPFDITVTGLKKNNFANKSNNKSKNNNGTTGIIIGSTLSGIIIIVLICFLIRRYIKRKKIKKDYYRGIIFEDSRGNLLAMGNEFQNLIPQIVFKNNYLKTQDFDITFKKIINMDSNVVVLIKNYRQFISKTVHFKYKKKDELEWKVFKDKIIIFDEEKYEFKWMIRTEK